MSKVTKLRKKSRRRPWMLLMDHLSGSPSSPLFASARLSLSYGAESMLSKR